MADEKKLLELHEKLEEKDEKLDAALVEVNQLKSALRKRTDKWAWLKNPAMLTALAGVLAGLGTTAENLWTRYLDEKAKIERLKEEEQEEEVKEESVGKLSELLATRQDEIEDTCLAYAEGIITSMPQYQRRKVNRWLEEQGLEPIQGTHREDPAPTEPESATSIGSAGGTKPASSPNLYQMIQEQVKTKDDVAIEELEEVLKGMRKRPHHHK